jgi:hypothetical protein
MSVMGMGGHDVRHGEHTYAHALFVDDRRPRNLVADEEAYRLGQVAGMIQAHYLTSHHVLGRRAIQPIGKGRHRNLYADAGVPHADGQSPASGNPTS